MSSKTNKLSMAVLPTPIFKLERLSQRLGKNIWLKRDDLTGIELSGNKVRKLEYIFYDILDKKCDYVITCGGKQSNHCRAVAAAAAKYGIKCLLVLSGKDDGSLDGNLFLDKLLGASCLFVEQSDEMEQTMEDAYEKLSREGYKPYIIPLGGSNALGANGYIDCYNEITDFEIKNSVNFNVIALAVGSGGTYAGLFAANEKSGGKKNITGISVLAQTDYISAKISEICAQMSINADIGKINVTDEYIGEGYGIASAEVMEFIKITAATEGILLDPVYTGKAFHGLSREIEKGSFADCENILFLHTGGLFGSFGQIKAFGL